MTEQRTDRSVGGLLRQWRKRRRLTQLEVSLRANVSARHLSFVETGRAKPSREMIVHLAEELDVPLRKRNELLLAGGFAPSYTERPLDSPELSAVRSAVRHVLAGHEPNPAVAVDRYWNMVDANRAIGLLTVNVDPELLEPPANVLKASLHPAGLAPRIVNIGEWRAHLLHRLRRQVTATADPELAALYDELSELPCEAPEPAAEAPEPDAIGATLRIRHDDRDLTFFSTVTVFGTPHDITVA
ncbi:MAG: helix-turn-helix domain-containing protein, partial [Gemmatimonadota bacterium]